MSTIDQTSDSPILAKLNPTQRRVVVANVPALLVIAGAGTGKTRVLTHRIAYWVKEQRIPPSSVLAATFTNKAAAEMSERIIHLTSPLSRLITMGTFHRICGTLLRRYADKHQFGHNFVIYDTSEQLAVVKQAMKESGLEMDKWKPSALHGRISRLKSDGITAKLFLDSDRLPDYVDEQLLKVYPSYQAKLQRAKALDFDDMILETTKLLTECEEARSAVREQYRWVFIDEFQDINRAQWDLIRAIAGGPGESNLFAVGDDDQAIYGWRGAHAGFLEEFRETYHPTLELLEDNYRSTEAILAIANKLIEEKAWGPIKVLRAIGEQGVKPFAFLASSDTEEALETGSLIESLRQSEHMDYRDIAVLYRRNAQSRIFEEVFTRLAIPHQIIGGQRFYQRQEIKDVIAYLRLVHNDRDDAALRRASQVPRRGIGEKSLDQLSALLAAEGIGLFELARQPELLRSFPARARAAIHGFIELISRLHSLQGKVSLPDLIEMTITESGMELALKHSKQIEDMARLDNLEELRGAVSDWSESYPDAGLAEYLEQQALIGDADTYDPHADAVTLMTLHAAKGLEFEAVFLVGLEEGLLPHSRSVDEGTLDEELRLCYVGVTRAKKRLFLSAAELRRFRGDTFQTTPSRFLRGMDTSLLEGLPEHLLVLTSELAGDGWSQESGVAWRRGLKAGAAARDSRNAGRSPRQNDDWPRRVDVGTREVAHRLAALHGGTAAQARTDSTFAIGQSVVHPKFGTGVIEAIQPAGQDHFLQIRFESEGVKMLAESAAPLERAATGAVDDSWGLR